MRVVRSMGLELVGICDQSTEALEIAGEEHGIPPRRQFKEAAALLEKTRPDCVVVATTATSHGSYVCQAAEAGAKYVLCEKPMATSLAECDRMIDVCKMRDTKLAINHQMRFMEQYTEPKRIINSEEFGGLSSVTVVAGNCGMAMNGTHYFEMFRYITDEVPVEVTAWFSEDTVPNPRGAQYVDPAGAVRMVTASGKRFYFEISVDQGHGMKVIYAGPYGQLLVDEMAGRMFLSVREEEYRNLPTTRTGVPRIDTEYQIDPADTLAPTQAVLDALLNGKNAPTGQDGRLAVELLVAAYISNESNHVPVTPNSDLPWDRVFPWA